MIDRGRVEVCLNDPILSSTHRPRSQGSSTSRNGHLQAHRRVRLPTSQQTTTNGSITTATNRCLQIATVYSARSTVGHSEGVTGKGAGLGKVRDVFFDLGGVVDSSQSPLRLMTVDQLERPS